ncbi:MAG: amidohydrolase family protein [Cyanobacteriota bacterium]
MSPYVALKAITDWAAYQYFEEASKGTLEPGKRADLVILERNPLKADPSRISAIRVVETIKDGRTIYRLGRDRIDGRKAAPASRVAADPLQSHNHQHRWPQTNRAPIALVEGHCGLRRGQKSAINPKK